MQLFVLLLLAYASDGFALPVENRTADFSSTNGAPYLTDEYDYTFGDVLATITAEFVFNMAGDHILLPVPSNADDSKLHKTALIMAELLQRLHTMQKVYAVLNNTAHDVATAKWSRTESQNLINAVMDKAIEKFEADPLLLPEYVAAKRAVESRVLALPPLHGRFASTKTQTMYDIRPEQLARAEKLLQDTLVKKVTMSVSFLKASEYEYETLPQWVREESRLASAMLTLAEDPEVRPSLQKAFDETLEENVDNFDVMFSGDDKVIFETLRRKIDGDAILKNKLQLMVNSKSAS